MLKRHSDGQELGELVSTARNTYVNPGSVAQFVFHQSDKSRVECDLVLVILPFLEWLDGVIKILVRHDFGFHHLNWGRISGCSYNLNIFNPLMSDTEILLTKICSGLKIHTVFIHVSWGVPDCSPRTSKSLSEVSSSSSPSHSLSLSDRDFTTVVECDGIVIVVNSSEPRRDTGPGVFNDEDSMFSARVLTASHQRLSFFTWKGLSPRDTNFKLRDLHASHTTNLRGDSVVPDLAISYFSLFENEGSASRTLQLVWE